jgi:adenylate cyclase
MSSPVYAELVPLGGGDAIPLAQDVMTLGRRKSNDICLDFGNVSGSHCEFLCEDGIWFVKDLGSSNGVKVNGEKVVGRKVLKPGDAVVIAKAHHYKIEYKLAKDAKARLDEIAEKEEDIFAVSLMEKAGLEKGRH